MSGNREGGGESVVFLLPEKLPHFNWQSLSGKQS